MQRHPFLLLRGNNESAFFVLSAKVMNKNDTTKNFVQNL